MSESSFRRRSSPISSSPATGSSCEVGSSSTTTAAGRPAPRRARRAGARPRRARRSAARADARCRAPARPPPPRAPPPPPPRRGSPAGRRARPVTVPITIWVSGSWNSVPTARASSPGTVVACVHSGHCHPAGRTRRRGSAAPGRWRRPAASTYLIRRRRRRTTSSPGSTTSDTSAKARPAEPPGYR